MQRARRPEVQGANLDDESWELQLSADLSAEVPAELWHVTLNAACLDPARATAGDAQRGKPLLRQLRREAGAQEVRGTTSEGGESSGGASDSDEDLLEGSVRVAAAVGRSGPFGEPAGGEPHGKGEPWDEPSRDGDAA